MTSWRDLTGVFRGGVRDLLALGAAATVIVGSLVALIVGRVDLGMSLVTDGDRMVIARVEPGNPASREGFAPGMVVLRMNDVELLRQSEPELEPEESREIPTPMPSGQPSPVARPVPGTGPAAATVSPEASTSVATAAPSAEPMASGSAAPIE